MGWANKFDIAFVALLPALLFRPAPAAADNYGAIAYSQDSGAEG
jgi:hypothetical protein